jgi:hypothetical protein
MVGWFPNKHLWINPYLPKVVFFFASNVLIFFQILFWGDSLKEKVRDKRAHGVTTKEQILSMGT